MMDTRERSVKISSRARAYSYTVDYETIPRIRRERLVSASDSSRLLSPPPLPTRRVASRHVSSPSSAPGGGGAAKTSDALVPPNPKLLDIAARIPSLFVFTIGA